MPEPLIDTFPVSSGQERLLALDVLDASGVQYAIVVAAQVGPGFAADRFAACVRSVVSRHDALRTTFVQEAARPVQQVHADLEPEVVVHRSVSPAESGELVARQARRPFDLRCGPLVRVLMVERTNGGWDVALSVHHAVADGLSMEIVFREIAALYRGAELPPAPAVQYPDWAYWQREHEAEQAAHLQFWLDELSGAPELLTLPWDRRRPDTQGSAGDTVHFALSADAIAGATQLARRHRVTPVALFHTVFAILLSRLSGQEDLVLATPMSGRGHADLEDVVGFFVNTVPVRLSVPGDASFSSLIKATAAKSIAASAYQDVPLERIVSAVAPRRDPAWHPLFQVLFSWDDSAGLEGLDGLDGLEVSRYPVTLPVAKFDLSLTLRSAGAALDGAFEFRTDLIDKQTVTRWARSFTVLLDALLAEPHSPVGQARLLSRDEERRLVQLGTGPVAPSTELALPALWARSVARWGSRPAMAFGDQVWTYTELDGWSASVARRLIQRGVGAGSRVGIRLPRSARLYAAVLAVLRTGAAYVPLDPTYPAARLDLMIADAAVEIVIDDEFLDDASADLGQPAPTCDLDAPALAYVMHTSGSTGLPKGVCVTHRSVVNLALAQGDVFGLRPEDRVAQFASLSFDVSVAEMWMTWARGAVLVMVPADSRVGPALARVLHDGEISVLFAAPSALATLNPAEHSALRVVVSTGEPCPPSLAETWGVGGRLINAYGPTEATVWATATTVTPGAELTIGRALPNASIRITDSRGVVVPLGVVGELRIGGLGVAAGYLDRPELTADRFVAGLYRTGDLGRMRPDGSIVLLGRVDDQIKLRGFRIELGEVESALTSHPAVSAAVAAVRSEDGTPRLVGYVVVAGGSVPADLRSWVAGRLPAHSVPASLRAIDAVPLSPAGKVDRSALPAADVDAPRPETGTGFVPPSTALERRLATLWASVLGIDRVGVHDNFFELGGNSLLLVRVFRELEAIDDLPRMELTDLFRFPTVAALAHTTAPAHSAVEAADGGDRSGSPRRRAAIARRRERRA